MRREKLNYFVIQIIRKAYNPVISASYIPHDGIQPCYFENLYAATWLLRAALSRYTTLLSQGLIYPTQAYSVPQSAGDTPHVITS